MNKLLKAALLFLVFVIVFFAEPIMIIVFLVAVFTAFSLKLCYKKRDGFKIKIRFVEVKK